MKIRNVWKDTTEFLEIHEDSRGRLSDIFYDETINHVAVIDSEPNVIRGNHYHKETTQHIFITKGSLEYCYKPVDSSEPAQQIQVNEGELVSTPPNEIHALKIGPEGNQFIVFTTGPRGGADYESDTFRVEMSIVSGPGEDNA
jgi:quercetin dioxygenase-like cupin family protein